MIFGAHTIFAFARYTLADFVAGVCDVFRGLAAYIGCVWSANVTAVASNAPQNMVPLRRSGE